MRVRLAILKSALREHLNYDLGWVGEPVAWAIFIVAVGLTKSWSTRHQVRGFKLLMRLHTSAWSPGIDRRVIERLRDAGRLERQGRATGLWALYDSIIDAAGASFRAGKDHDPRRLIGEHMMVVKAAGPHERGVVVVDYSYVFPLVAALFDLPRIAERYAIVLEPSWAGVCMPEILLYDRVSSPVYVQTTEPRDKEFLRGLETSLDTVPIAANWWVDPGLAPPPGAKRDIDVIMVAAWADIKRHWRVFKAISQLRRRGHKLKVALVGYKSDRTRNDIESLAEYFGIQDQIEIHELIPPEAVTVLLLRSKIHVLWSRRECANRAIIEAMIAGVPVIVREGMTFGFKYPYINEQTGRFVPEHGLADAILQMLESLQHYRPREWVLEHMVCTKATLAIEEHLRRRAAELGASWTDGLVAKTSTLYGQRYLHTSDQLKFKADYEFLESTVRDLPGARSGA